MSSPSRSPLAVRDFRLLWFGESVSVLGDQFALVALPWLALLLTGSPLALGTVLALMAVPRAVLMIVGGAYVDRLSPRTVMLVSNGVRLVAVALLGGIVLAGAAQLWMLYIFALVFGIADAFFYPAHTAIVPDLVSSDQLQRANGIAQGTAQLSVLIGPALAGIAIAGLSSAQAGPGLTGVGVALLIDALTFLVSLGALALIKPRPAHPGANDTSVVTQIREGIAFAWQAKALRVVMLLSMLLNFLITGPFEVGIPVLAFSRLPEGAAAFGLMNAGFGAGSVLGLIAATMLPALPKAHFGTVMLLLIASTGVAIVAMAFATSTLHAIAVAVVIGSILGYTNVSFLTWLQRRIPRALMGRVMSLLMFSSIALVPISMAIAGALVEISLEGLFVVAGVGMALITLLALFSRNVRQMGLEPILDEKADPDAADAQVASPRVPAAV
ncbi:MAG TPA: MFS transporter [Candidatus Limnocylindrales bacterium]|nr:MFS transporter [Candidatus Limnocylindrales bacterium]